MSPIGRLVSRDYVCADPGHEMMCDTAAGHTAFLLNPYLPPRERKLRLPDIYEMFEQMKDHV